MNIEKFEHLNNKMNKITQELTKNVEISEDILTTTEELESYLVTPKSAPIEGQLITGDSDNADEPVSKALAPVTEIAADVVDVQAMIEDFCYMRAMLRETTQNSRRVLESVTEELVLSEGESRALLVSAYSELNKAQIESVKLFMQSYKEISTILVNLTKINQSNTPHTVHTTNVLNIEDQSHISSADIINRLRGPK
nr:MAG TPA: Terminase DNA packaging enzyme small [Caudoviricetes sp.]